MDRPVQLDSCCNNVVLAVVFACIFASIIGLAAGVAEFHYLIYVCLLLLCLSIYQLQDDIDSALRRVKPRQRRVQPHGTPDIFVV